MRCTMIPGLLALGACIFAAGCSRDEDKNPVPQKPKYEFHNHETHKTDEATLDPDNEQSIKESTESRKSHSLPERPHNVSFTKPYEDHCSDSIHKRDKCSSQKVPKNDSIDGYHHQERKQSDRQSRIQLIRSPVGQPIGLQALDRELCLAVLLHLPC